MDNPFQQSGGRDQTARDAAAAAQATADSKQTARAALTKYSVHGSDIASAATIDLGAATGDLVDVTGTTTITAITLSEGAVRTVQFTGVLTLTHGASLVLPNASNITTAAGEFAIFRGYAAGVVRCVGYSPYLKGTANQITVAGRTLSIPSAPVIPGQATMPSYTAGGTGASDVMVRAEVSAAAFGFGPFRYFPEAFAILSQYVASLGSGSSNRGRWRASTTTTTGSGVALVTERWLRNASNLFTATVGHGVVGCFSQPLADNLIGLFYGSAVGSGVPTFDPLSASGFSAQARINAGNWEVRAVHKNGATEVTGSWNVVGAGTPLLELAAICTATGFRVRARLIAGGVLPAWTTVATITGVTWGTLGADSGIALLNTVATACSADFHEFGLVAGATGYGGTP